MHELNPMMKRTLVRLAALFFVFTLNAAEIHVRPDGPIRTLAEAQRAARKGRAGVVIVHAGTYHLPGTLVFTSEDSGTEYRAADGEKVVISGAAGLDLKWEPYKDGIFRAKTQAGLLIDQLFVNGQLQHLARYPNYDPGAMRPKRFGAGANGEPDAPKFNGSSRDSTSPQRVAGWADPAGGYVHTIQAALWGSMHYRIVGKKADGTLELEGGWQHNRPDKGAHKDFRFVENIFEELDAPGEWFHDARTNILYFYPPKEVDLQTAKVESVRLRHLIEFSGTKERPVKSVSLSGMTFTAAARTFMENKESLLRSDWTIYRGGAVFLRGAENCAIEKCDFEQLGGNAIFISGYNRNVAVRGCLIRECGANGVAIVGEPKAVRSPMFSWGPGNPYSSGKPQLEPREIDRAPGPLTEDYPAGCLVEDCLITRIGRLEKQSACVEISMAQDITVRHCSAYEVPRAGINIGDGCWGGHVIEFCDVFDTVLETGDHGSFNSWGRDRYWGSTGRISKLINDVAPIAGFAFADAMKPNILRNNRWRCDYGFDVDLDDGSSNYEITNNLMLGRGLKLREGFRRIVRNNIIVNNSLHPHCWFPGSEDVFTQNIVMRPYSPAAMQTDLWGRAEDRNRWGREIDHNLFTTSEADRIRFAVNGCDAHSLVGELMFMDPARGDYRVKQPSPALQLGFQNFPMDPFGVTSLRLKRIARVPDFPKIEKPTAAVRDTNKLSGWQGAKLRELGEMEFSALQISESDKGVILAECPAESVAYQMGLRAGDFVQSVDGRTVRNVEEFLKAAGRPVSGKNMKFSLRRMRQEMTVETGVHGKQNSIP
jgi:Right handed beta helix region